MKVLNKLSGKEQLIKSARFNPEIHKQIGDIFTMTRGLDYSQPVNVQLDGIEGALARGEAQREKGLAEKRAEVKEETLQVIPDEKVEEIIDTPAEEVENEGGIDLSNVSEDKVKDLSWNQLRALAKSMGLVSGSVSRELLQAQVIDKIKSNLSNLTSL